MSKASLMNSASVTIVIAGNAYTLRADDPQGLRDMPAVDRDQLIGLLEQLKAQRDKSQRLAQNVSGRSIGTGAVAQKAAGAAVQDRQPGERLGKGDVDAIMARLIMEEAQQRKPGLKPATIYMFAGVVLVIIALLSAF